MEKKSIEDALNAIKIIADSISREKAIELQDEFRLVISVLRNSSEQ